MLLVFVSYFLRLDALFSGYHRCGTLSISTGGSPYLSEEFQFRTTANKDSRSNPRNLYNRLHFAVAYQESFCAAALRTLEFAFKWCARYWYDVWDSVYFSTMFTYLFPELYNFDFMLPFLLIMLLLVTTVMITMTRNCKWHLKACVTFQWYIYSL